MSARLMSGGTSSNSVHRLDPNHAIPLAIAGRVLPLEMLPIGQFDIVYRSPLDVRGGELPVRET